MSSIDHLEDSGVDGRIIFNIDLQEMGCEVMDWIELAQDKDRWQALMNAVMNIWGGPKKIAGNFLTS